MINATATTSIRFIAGSVAEDRMAVPRTRVPPVHGQRPGRAPLRDNVGTAWQAGPTSRTNP